MCVTDVYFNVCYGCIFYCVLGMFILMCVTDVYFNVCYGGSF